MIRIKPRVALVLFSFVSLSNCQSLRDVINSSSVEPSVSIPGTNLDGWNNNTYVHPITLDPDKTDNYYKMTSNPYKNDDLGKSWDVALLPSTGNQKMLVVPIRFTDTPTKYGNDADVMAGLNRAFFGESADTIWESVTSFYTKSSYGKFSLSGEITPIFNLNMSTTQLERKIVNNDYWDETHYVLESVYNTYSASTFLDYDQNGDGYVDSVFFVYLAPYKSTGIFWAYQYYWNRYPNLSKPVFSTYAWASIEFMFEESGSSLSKPDAHTYIHETGHILGLDDYYDYDDKTAPVGGPDMMDHNIIDNNMYSKYLLNWSLPYVPVGNSDIYLRPAEKTGDFIIINNKWNGHAYDEYILIEYYTPTGLNEFDSFNRPPLASKGFSQNGVRIYHIDSRLIALYASNQSRWTDVIFPPSNNYYVDYAISNTGSTTQENGLNSAFKRVHLLDAQKKTSTWYHTTIMANNFALFKTGDKILADDWQRYLFSGATFNDGDEIGYSVEIGAMDQDGVTIIIRSN